MYLKTVVSLFKDTDFLERGFPNKTVVGEVGGTSGLLLMQLWSILIVARYEASLFSLDPWVVE